MRRKVRQGLAKPSFRNGQIGSIPISSAKFVTATCAYAVSLPFTQGYTA